MKQVKELIVAVNALMHQDMMDRIKPFLDFLEEIKTDYITVGDAGVFTLSIAMVIHLRPSTMLQPW